MIILNLTQHTATPEQVTEGVVEPEEKAIVLQLLTFTTLPTAEDLRNRAKALASLAGKSGASAAMIGGAPFFMAPLEKALSEVCVKPLYAFSVRESVEVVESDGCVNKQSVFRHAGFIECAGLNRCP